MRLTSAYLNVNFSLRSKFNRIIEKNILEISSQLGKGAKSKAQTLHKIPVEWGNNFLAISNNYKLVNFVFTGE